MTCELVLDVRAELGEAPVWDDRRERLLFVDIMRGHIHEFDPATGKDRVVEVGRPVGCVALSERGDWIAGTSDGFYRVDPHTGRAALIAPIEAELTDNRMNDGYVDARGRLWAGTMGMGGLRERGSLYRLDPDGTVRRDADARDDVERPRIGVRTTARSTSPTSRSAAIDGSTSSRWPDTIANRRPFVEVSLEVGYPDGLIVDAEGFVWVGSVGGRVAASVRA